MDDMEDFTEDMELEQFQDDSTYDSFNSQGEVMHKGDLFLDDAIMD